MEFLMVSIADLNIVPLANLPKSYASGSIKAALQGLSATEASNAFEGSASGVGTNLPSTGFTATPRLSADVIDALLKSQTQQSAGGTSGANGTATTLSGASEEKEQTAASSDPSANPPTLQQIAGRFDLHNLTNTQFESLAKQLSAAGAISGSALIDIATKLGGLGVSPALEGKPSSDKIVSIWDGVADNTPPYDVVNKVKGWLTADTQAGFPQAQTDQQILGVLNQLSSLRNGA
jgi:hypothetical protein